MNENYAANYRNALNSQLEEKYSDSRQRAAAEFIKMYGSKSVLEIGCATNPISNYMDQIGNSVRSVVTIEPNKSFFDGIQRANAFPIICKLHNLSLEQYVNDPLRLGIKHDFIVINCLLQEIEDPFLFLAQVKKISEKNGLVWVSVPNADSIHRILAKTEVEFQKSSFGRKWSFNMNSLKMLLDRAGVKVYFQQTRILKPLDDTSILEMLDLKPEFSDILSGWLNFESSTYYFGAEIDLLFEFN